MPRKRIVRTRVQTPPAVTPRTSSRLKQAAVPDDEETNVQDETISIGNTDVEAKSQTTPRKSCRKKQTVLAGKEEAELQDDDVSSVEDVVAENKSSPTPKQNSRKKGTVSVEDSVVEDQVTPTPRKNTRRKPISAPTEEEPPLQDEDPVVEDQPKLTPRRNIKRKPISAPTEEEPLLQDEDPVVEDQPKLTPRRNIKRKPISAPEEEPPLQDEDPVVEDQTKLTPRRNTKRKPISAPTEEEPPLQDEDPIVEDQSKLTPRRNTKRKPVTAPVEEELVIQETSSLEETIAGNKLSPAPRKGSKRKKVSTQDEDEEELPLQIETSSVENAVAVNKSPVTPRKTCGRKQSCAPVEEEPLSEDEDVEMLEQVTETNASKVSCEVKKTDRSMRTITRKNLVVKEEVKDNGSEGDGDLKMEVADVKEETIEEETPRIGKPDTVSDGDVGETNKKIKEENDACDTNQGKVEVGDDAEEIASAVAGDVEETNDEMVVSGDMKEEAGDGIIEEGMQEVYAEKISGQEELAELECGKGDGISEKINDITADNTSEAEVNEIIDKPSKEEVNEIIDKPSKEEVNDVAKSPSKVVEMTEEEEEEVNKTEDEELLSCVPQISDDQKNGYESDEVSSLDAGELLILDDEDAEYLSLFANEEEKSGTIKEDNKSSKKTSTLNQGKQKDDKKSIVPSKRDTKSKESVQNEKNTKSKKKMIILTEKDFQSSSYDDRDKKSSTEKSKDKKSSSFDILDVKSKRENLHGDKDRHKRSSPTSSRDKRHSPNSDRDKRRSPSDDRDTRRSPESREWRRSSRDDKDKRSSTRDDKDKRSSTHVEKDRKGISPTDKATKTNQVQSKGSHSSEGSRNTHIPKNATTHLGTSGCFQKIVIISNSLYEKKLKRFESPLVKLILDENLNSLTIVDIVRKNKADVGKNALWVLVSGIFSVIDNDIHATCKISSCESPMTTLKPFGNINLSEEEIKNQIKEILHTANILCIEIQKVLGSDGIIAMVPPIPAAVVQEESFKQHTQLHVLAVINNAPVATQANLLNMKTLYNVFCEAWTNMACDRMNYWIHFSEFQKLRDKTYKKNLVPIINKESFAYVQQDWADTMRVFFNLVLCMPFPKKVLEDPLKLGDTMLGSKATVNRNADDSDDDVFDRVVVLGNTKFTKMLQDDTLNMPVIHMNENLDFDEDGLNFLNEQQKKYPSKTLWVVLSGVSEVAEPVGSGPPKCAATGCQDLIPAFVTKNHKLGDPDFKGMNSETMVNLVMKQAFDFATVVSDHLGDGSAMFLAPIMPLQAIWAGTGSSHTHDALHRMFKRDPTVPFFIGGSSDWIKCSRMLETKWLHKIMANLPRDSVPQALMRKYMKEKQPVLEYVDDVMEVNVSGSRETWCKLMLGLMQHFLGIKQEPDPPEVMYISVPVTEDDGKSVPEAAVPVSYIVAPPGEPFSNQVVVQQPQQNFSGSPYAVAPPPFVTNSAPYEAIQPMGPYQQGPTFPVPPHNNFPPNIPLPPYGPLHMSDPYCTPPVAADPWQSGWQQPPPPPPTTWQAPSTVQASAQVYDSAPAAPAVVSLPPSSVNQVPAASAPVISSCTIQAPPKLKEVMKGHLVIQNVQTDMNQIQAKKLLQAFGELEDMKWPLDQKDQLAGFIMANFKNRKDAERAERILNYLKVFGDNSEVKLIGSKQTEGGTKLESEDLELLLSIHDVLERIKKDSKKTKTAKQVSGQATGQTSVQGTYIKPQVVSQPSFAKPQVPSQSSFAIPQVPSQPSYAKPRSLLEPSYMSNQSSYLKKSSSVEAAFPSKAASLQSAFQSNAVQVANPEPDHYKPIKFEIRAGVKSAAMGTPRAHAPPPAKEDIVDCRTVVVTDYTEIVPVHHLDTMFREIGALEDGILGNKSLHYTFPRFGSDVSLLKGFRFPDKVLKLDIQGASEEQQMLTSNLPAVKQKVNVATAKVLNEIVKVLKEKIDEEVNVYTFKTRLCKFGSNCELKALCPAYHNKGDRRRCPVLFKYSDENCPQMEGTGMCDFKDRCPKAHSPLERLFHFKHYRSNVCLGWHVKGACDKVGRVCSSVHPDKPEMFYHEKWENLYVEGLKNSIDFLAAAIRNLFAFPDLKCLRVLLVTPSSEMAKLYVKCVSDLAISCNQKLLELTEKETNLDNATVIVATVESILSYLPTNKGSQSRRLDCSRLKALIFDDGPTISKDLPLNKRSVFKEFGLRRDLNVVVTAEKMTGHGIADAMDILALPVSFKRIYDDTGDPKDRPKTVVPVTRLSPPPPRQPQSSKSRQDKKPQQQQQQQQSQSSKKKKKNKKDSSSPQDLDIGIKPGSKANKKMLAAEDDLKREHDRELKLYIEMPEVHPEYEQKYSIFIDQYRRQFPGRHDMNHSDKLWKVFWKELVTGILQEEYQKKREGLRIEFMHPVLNKQEAKPSASTKRKSSDERYDHKGKKSQRIDEQLTNVNKGRSMQSRNMDRSGLLQALQESEDVDMREALDLLQEISPDLGILGPAVKLLTEKIRSSWSNKKEVNALLQDKDNGMVLQMVSEKAKSLSERNAPGPYTLKLELASMQALKLINYHQPVHKEEKLHDFDVNKVAHGLEVNNISHGLDVNKVARATYNKDPAYIIQFIKNALLFEGIKNATNDDVTDIYVAVTSAHFAMAYSKPEESSSTPTTNRRDYTDNYSSVQSQSSLQSRATESRSNSNEYDYSSIQGQAYQPGGRNIRSTSDDANTFSQRQSYQARGSNSINNDYNQSGGMQGQNNQSGSKKKKKKNKRSRSSGRQDSNSMPVGRGADNWSNFGNDEPSQFPNRSQSTNHGGESSGFGMMDTLLNRTQSTSQGGASGGLGMMEFLSQF